MGRNQSKWLSPTSERQSYDKVCTVLTYNSFATFGCMHVVVRRCTSCNLTL